MAVPVQGAKILFEAILKSFAGIEYDSIEPNEIFNKAFWARQKSFDFAEEKLG